MKKNNFFLIIPIALLLTSCSTPTPSPENSATNKDNQRLGNIFEEPAKSPSQSGPIKYPVGGTKSSGDIILPQKAQELELLEDENLISQNLETQNDNSQLLATYRSKVYTKTEDRQKNLRIVCEKLTGKIIKPNQEFSYNTTCGPYNKENGFGKATVFLGDGTETQDYGGGVCQLSSTLYNAVKDLNVEILERHKHSKKVYYVPDGQDATVSYGNLDFRFKNLNNYSIRIEATSNSEFVEVNIYKA